MINKIYVASDHAGFPFKEKIKKFLTQKKFEVEDLGTYSLESTNYAQYGNKIAHAVVNNPGTVGIAICGTGIGISIAANRIKGVRAARVCTTEDAKLAREHNNANIITFGERTMDEKQAKKIIEVFLSQEFAKGRHEIRVNSLDTLT